MKHFLLIPALIAALLLPPKAEAQITPQGGAIIGALVASAAATAWVGYKAATALISMGNSGNQTFEGYVPNGQAPEGHACPDGNIDNSLAQLAISLWFINCHAIMSFGVGQCSPPPAVGSETDNSVCMSPAIVPGLGDAGCTRANAYSNALYPGHSACG